MKKTRIARFPRLPTLEQKQEDTVAKKAFCVGINDYPYDDSDLNDARAWAKLSTERFDFPKSEVEMATDSEATKANMVAGIKNLLSGASSGDVLGKWRNKRRRIFSKGAFHV